MYNIKRVATDLKKELNQIERTEFIRGQIMALDKVLSFKDITELKEFLLNQIEKLENLIFVRNSGKELSRGMYLGYMKINNYIERLDGYGEK